MRVVLDTNIFLSALLSERGAPAQMLMTRMTSRAEAPDPGDSYLIAMAIASGADFLVTGDKLLLSLKRIGGTSIFSPRRFATMLGR